MSMREPTLQLRLLFAYLLPARNYQHPSLFLVLPDSALKNGRSWNSAANNKLHAIYPTVGKCVHNSLISRRDAVIINRLKIVHSLNTLFVFVSGEDQPTCTKCDTVLTVKHIRLDCPELREVWLKKYFTA